MTDFYDHNDHRMRILLVGSENALCESLRPLWENDGYEVLSARDGGHALTIFHRSMRPINLLVTDYNTPDITGLELARACEYHNPDLAVLYISASAPNDELQTDLATHRRAFLAKPVRRSNLLRKARELLAPDFAPRAIPEPPEFQPTVQTRCTEESAREAS